MATFERFCNAPIFVQMNWMLEAQTAKQKIDAGRADQDEDDNDI